MPVPQLQQVIDSRHFAELQAFARIECWPDAWTVAGQMAAAIANHTWSEEPCDPDIRTKMIAKPPMSEAEDIEAQCRRMF